MLMSLEHLFSVCPGTDISVKAEQKACATGKCEALFCLETQGVFLCKLTNLTAVHAGLPVL